LNKKVVSLITARGGSKGIPKKNILNIKGKPLISYTIQESLKSNVNETWVSTEDKEIAKISKKFGAQIIERPSELSNDIIMPDASLVHFAQNYDFDVLVFIQPTSPLLNFKYINLGLEMMDKYDSVFSAYGEHWLPRWRRENILGTSVSVPVDWDISNRPRRQDMEELFVENGAFYITTKDNILESNLRYSKNIGIVEMPYYTSFQVDSNDDLEIIKKLL
jgi:CMP-N-acetylneuraminic acid synthetase